MSSQQTFLGPSSEGQRTGAGRTHARTLQRPGTRTGESRGEARAEAQGEAAPPVGEARRSISKADATGPMVMVVAGSGVGLGAGSAQAVEEEEDSGVEEAKYGYKNALWLTKSRALLEAVKDDKAIAALVDDKGSFLPETLPVNAAGAAEAGREHEPRSRHSARRPRRHGSSQDPHGMPGLGTALPIPMHDPQQQTSHPSDTLNEEDEEMVHPPAAAEEAAWENEIARNILNLYATKVRLNGDKLLRP